jgi:hypothetical protein
MRYLACAVSLFCVQACSCPVQDIRVRCPCRQVVPLAAYALSTEIVDGCPGLMQSGTTPQSGGPLNGPATTPVAGSVTLTQSRPGRWPHQFCQKTIKSAASISPGWSTTGRRVRFEARTIRTGSIFRSARTMPICGRPRNTQGSEPTFVNSTSPWAPPFSPSRPPLTRSAALMHIAATDDDELPGSVELRPLGAAAPAGTPHPAATTAVHSATSIDRSAPCRPLGTRAALRIMHFMTSTGRIRL